MIEWKLKKQGRSYRHEIRIYPYLLVGNVSKYIIRHLISLVI